MSKKNKAVAEPKPETEAKEAPATTSEATESAAPAARATVAKHTDVNVMRQAKQPYKVTLGGEPIDGFQIVDKPENEHVIVRIDSNIDPSAVHVTSADAE